MMKAIRGVAALGLGVLACVSSAQPVALVLGPDDLAGMSPEARAHFETASRTVFQSPGSSFEELRQAAEMAPNVVDLQFLLADFALSMTMHSASPESYDYNRVMLESAERIVANPNADARRLRRMSNFLSLYYVPNWNTRRAARVTPGLTEDSNDRIGTILEGIRERLGEASPEAVAPPRPRRSPPRAPAP